MDQPETTLSRLWWCIKERKNFRSGLRNLGAFVVVQSAISIFFGYFGVGWVSNYSVPILGVWLVLRTMKDVGVPMSPSHVATAIAAGSIVLLIMLARPYMLAPVTPQPSSPSPLPAQPQPQPISYSITTVAPAPGYDCFGFYPTETEPVRQFAERRFGGDLAFWNGVKSENDLRARLVQDLQAFSNPGAPVPLDSQQQLRTLLLERCQRLNGASLRPVESFEKFSWLASIYRDEIMNSPPSPGTHYSDCSEEAPLSDNAWKMLQVWMAFNQGLNDIAIKRARALDSEFGEQADDQEFSVGNTSKPALGDLEAKCTIMSHGLLNDVAAARWVLAKLAATDKESNADRDSLMCVHEGWVYDRRLNHGEGDFWRPADDATGHVCHETGNSDHTHR